MSFICLHIYPHVPSSIVSNSLHSSRQKKRNPRMADPNLSFRYLANIQMPVDINPIVTRINLAFPHIKPPPLKIPFNQVTDLSEPSTIPPCIKPYQIIP